MTHSFQLPFDLIQHLSDLLSMLVFHNLYELFALDDFILFSQWRFFV